MLSNVCVMHLYSNFRKKHPGKQLKEIMWRAAKASYPQAWEREMREMRSVNEEAYKGFSRFHLYFGASPDLHLIPNVM